MFSYTVSHKNFLVRLDNIPDLSLAAVGTSTFFFISFRDFEELRSIKRTAFNIAFRKPDLTFDSKLRRKPILHVTYPTQQAEKGNVYKNKGINCIHFITDTKDQRLTALSH